MNNSKKIKKSELELLKVLCTNPNDLKYFKNTINHKFYLKTMNKFMGRDLGYEIECEGCLIEQDDILAYQLKHLGCTEYDNEEEIIGTGKEYKLRISGYKGAKALYKFCQIAKEELTINTTGSVHVHVDAHDLWKQAAHVTYQYDEKIFAEINRQNPHSHQNVHYESIYKNTTTDILNMLRSDRTEELYFLKEKIYKYTGAYNSDDYSTSKGYCIAVRNKFKTLEYRMGKCTFLYETLIKWSLCSTLHVNAIYRGEELSRDACLQIMEL